jgi:glucokinase
MGRNNKNKNKFYAGVDLGGTSFLAVVTNGDGKVLGSKEESTPASKGDARPVIAQVADAVRKAAKKGGVRLRDLRALGVGAAGAVDLDRGVVQYAPNLGWKDVPLADELARELGVDTYLDNDVHVAIRGEHELGAAKGARDAIGIWVGTGIGGGLIVRGRLHTGRRGSAGEVGHTVVVVDGPQCACGKKGCAEALASRTAMERQVRAAAESGRRSAALRIMEETGKPRMTSSVIAKALAEKDPVMTEVFGSAQRALAILASNLVNVLDPEVVVIGGGIAERMGEDFVAPIRAQAYELFLQQKEREKVRIVPSKLGERSGAIGAALLARASA